MENEIEIIEIEKLNSILGKLKEPKNKKDWVRVRDEMFVHTRGRNPGDILTKRRPNEDPDVQKYRLEIYEPITKGSINKAIDKLYRIFQNANFSIKVSPELDGYLDKKKFSGQYFYSFIQKYVVRRMIEDPNGYLVWIPTGDGLFDPTIPIEVEPFIVSSDEIYFLTDDVITWEDEEEHSIVTVNGRPELDGEIYYTLTKNSFYKHEQFGNKIDKTFRVTEIYRHNLDFLPAIVLGGDLTDDDYFESYFSPFIPFANEALRQYSDWQGVMTTTAFPYREEVAETCSAKGCRDGYIWDPKNEISKECRKCKGTGKVISRSPFGVFLREKGNGAFDSGTNNDAPLVRFISPPVDVIKYSGEAWETLLRKAEQALHLNFVEDAQSGVAKEIDREDSYSMLTKISNNIFDELIYKSLLIIEKYRNINEPIDPIIVKPISFSMKTEGDLIDEMNKLNDKNAPVAFLVESTKDLAKKRFSGNKSVSRIVEILVSYDPIFNLSTKDKQMLLASGSIKKEDLLKSLFSYKTLMKLTSAFGTQYLEKPLNDIFNDLDKELNLLINEYIPKTVIDTGGFGVDSELNRKQAEAQANLKGTVGGVQGILQIQESVSKGITKRDAALSLLQTIYGFELDQAEKILGEPVETQI